MQGRMIMQQVCTPANLSPALASDTDLKMSKLTFSLFEPIQTIYRQALDIWTTRIGSSTSQNDAVSTFNGPGALLSVDLRPGGSSAAEGIVRISLLSFKILSRLIVWGTNDASEHTVLRVSHRAALSMTAYSV